MQEIILDAAPTALAFFTLPHDVFNQHPTRRELFFGLANGDLGQLFLDSATHHFGASLPSTERCGAVNQLFSAFDMTGNGMTEIAVGREDGYFEIYDMDNTGCLQLVNFCLA
jgi:hypothetical protein